ncbi:MAG: MFS transporter [Daejeonella sp.]
MKYITRAVWILSLVSMLTDISSEMLYPVMPVYLRHIGFSIVLIGVLEGFAEAIAGLSKGYFGKLSDRVGKRLPFVQAGYFLSAISKPMMVAFTYPWWIFSARSIDRIGKGIRTGARDAILSDESTPENKGKVFGFHRSMDTLGAAIGPFLALVFLYFYPGNYTLLFLLAFIPAFAGVLTTIFLKEKKKEVIALPKAKFTFFAFINYWKESPAAYRQLLFGLLAFALINSSDVFLLLMMKNQGLSDTAVIGFYIFYNLVFTFAAFPSGIMADKIGLRRTLIIGLIIFMFVYFGMAYNNFSWGFYVLFFLYGIYAAFTEGVSKALISNIADKKDTATAIGTYTAFGSIMAMFASSLAGLIWYNFGASSMFIFSGTGAFLVVVYFLFFDRKPTEVQIPLSQNV